MLAYAKSRWEGSLATIVSRIIRLRLAYDCQEVAAPTSLILKTGFPNGLLRSGMTSDQIAAVLAA